MTNDLKVWKHCHLDCVLAEFTQFMWHCQKTASPCTPGCRRMWSAPASSTIQPPASPLRLDHSSLSLPQHHCSAELERGGMLDDMNHVNTLGGGGGSLSVRTHTRTLSYCTLLSMKLSHTHTHRALHTRGPPVVSLATLRQIQTFPLKAEPKPTTIVCCWILWGAFPSCQFVQVGIKKTSWPT